MWPFQSVECLCETFYGVLVVLTRSSNSQLYLTWSHWTISKVVRSFRPPSFLVVALHIVSFCGQRVDVNRPSDGLFRLGGLTLLLFFYRIRRANRIGLRESDGTRNRAQLFLAFILNVFVYFDSLYTLLRFRSHTRTLCFPFTRLSPRRPSSAIRIYILRDHKAH